LGIKGAIDHKWRKKHIMFRKFLIPAAMALALVAASGAASAKTYYNFSAEVGTPYHGSYPAPHPYGVFYGPWPFGGGFGFYNRPHMHPCDPVVVGYRKVWSEKRHRYIRKPITRCF
jgi:hypothetical protein